MVLQPINFGAAANDRTGDSLREAMRKTQQNFEYLDQGKADAQATALALESKVTAEAGKSLMTDAEHQKLAGIASGAQVNVATNLALGAATANAREITSSTGGSVTLPAATSSTAGLMTAAESTKLGTVATNASANSSDAFLLNRANHSGTQPLSTITGAGTAAAMNAIGAGGIIEQGSNSNGEYVKFADGTLICTYSRLTNTVVNAGFGYAPSTNFAAVFTARDYWHFDAVFYTGSDATGYQIYGLTYTFDIGNSQGVGASILNTGVLPSFSHPNFTMGPNAANSVRVNAFAKGRWK